jgi:diguanylate cyclase (GGDEF)-like protein
MNAVSSSSKPIWQQAIDAMNVEAWELRDIELKRSRSGLQEAEKLSKKYHYQLGLARSQVVSSYHHYRQGRLGEALTEASDALPVLQENQDSWLPRIYNNMSMIQMDLGNTTIAFEYLQQQLVISQAQGDQDMEATAYHDLGWVFSQDDRHISEAIHYFELALKMFSEGRHPGGAEIALLNLADCNIKLKNYQKARRYAFEALEAAKEGRAWGSNAYQILGEIELAEGRPQQALDYLVRSLEIAQEREAGREPRVFLQMGKCLHQLDRTQEALDHFLSALDHCSGQGNKLFLPDCHYALSEFYKDQNNFQKALEHFTAFHQTKESIARDAMDYKRNALEVFYRTESLKHDMELQKQQNLELKKYISELENLHQEVKELSIRDHLTNLYNRRYLFDYLELLKKRASMTSIAIIDIDHFKAINDTFTHFAGDEVLKGIAAFLTAFSRETDIAARYGGEEFVMVFPESSLEQAFLACERLRSTIENHTWDETYPDLKVTLSIGLVTGQVKDYEKLLAEADKKLYEAKAAGRNCIKWESRDLEKILL